MDFLEQRLELKMLQNTVLLKLRHLGVGVTFTSTLGCSCAVKTMVQGREACFVKRSNLWRSSCSNTILFSILIKEPLWKTDVKLRWKCVEFI